MKVSFIVGLFVYLTTVIASNWSPEDYEIFKLRDKIEEDLGKGITFYSWLNLSKGPKSTLDEINKAYRKKSRGLHPDKFHKAKKSVKKTAEERFQRLSLVGNILRDNSLKQRYDYFLSNGFPKWVGTGYFYSRFRPGMLATIGGLFVLIGIFHYFSLKISRSQDYKRIVELKADIKKRAWNGSLFPPADGSDRKVMSPTNGKEFLVSSSGDVSLIENDEHEGRILHLLDEADIDTIGFRDTIFYRVPVFVYNKVLGPVLGEIKAPLKEKKQEEETKEDKKPKKKKNKGEKIELPNGKVIYGRKKK